MSWAECRQGETQAEVNRTDMDMVIMNIDQIPRVLVPGPIRLLGFVAPNIPLLCRLGDAEPFCGHSVWLRLELYPSTMRNTADGYRRLKWNRLGFVGVGPSKR